MKLAISPNNLQISGTIGEESNFTIEMNAKMFKVLSDSQYKDKIGTIIREVSCNAVDAHIEAGTPDLPFTLHIPNALEPWLSIKDNGVGLSDNDIRKLYTAYGKSTKDKSNEATGAYGLGSKTPFAYADQFTITSIFNGMCRTYVAAKGNNGLPIINCQAVFETDEHNGLEVFIAVETCDFREFQRSILKQLQFFPVKPILTNNRESLDFSDITTDDHIALTNGNLTLFDGDYYSPIKGLWFVQGGVGYKVDLELLEGINSESKNFAKEIYNIGAFINVPIGTIEVTASREGISYTPATVTGITKILAECIVRICEDAITEITSTHYLWERVRIFNGLISVIQSAVESTLSHGVNHLDGAVKKTNNTYYIPTKKISKLHHKLTVFKKNQKNRSCTSTNWRFNRFEIRSDTQSGSLLIPKDDMVIIVRDTNIKPLLRLKAYSNEHDHPDMVVIEDVWGGKVKGTPYTIALALNFPHKNIIMLSSIEPPIPAPRVNDGSSTYGDRPKAWLFNNTHNMEYSSKGWQPVYCDSLDDIGEAIYVPMDHHTINVTTDLKTLYKAIDGKIITTQLLAINNMTVKRIEKGKIGDQLITVATAIDGLMAKAETYVKMFIHRNRISNFVDTLTETMYYKTMIEANDDSIFGNSPFKKVSTLQQRVDVLSKQMEGFIPMMSLLTTSDPMLLKTRDAANKLITAMDKRYPMMTHINGPWLDEDEQKDSITYIKMVNSSC